MGSGEPVEHWAGPESLDPTPVWKQYLIVVLLALAFVALAGAYAYVAVLPDAVTPPAAIPGRVILAVSDHPPGTTKVVTVAGRSQTFFLSNLGAEQVAVRAFWSETVGGSDACTIALIGGEPYSDEFTVRPGVVADPRIRFLDSCTKSGFDARGALVSGSAPRGLDRYLVSRKGDRLIVNTDHVIQGKP